MMFNDTFNNISVCFRGLGLWCLTDTFNNISVCFRGLGLWFNTLSTIFQFVLGVRVMMFNDTFNNILSCGLIDF